MVTKQDQIPQRHQVGVKCPAKKYAASVLLPESWQIASAEVVKGKVVQRFFRGFLHSLSGRGLP
jgi:hypothetical protein